jgi:hypothetical protein
MYWLACVYHVWKEDPSSVNAIVVGTYSDQQKREKFSDQLLKHYQFIKDYFEVSCHPKKQLNIDKLVDKLLEMSETDKTFNTFIPESYIMLECKLEAICESSPTPFISWEDYEVIAIDCGKY